MQPHAATTALNQQLSTLNTRKTADHRLGVESRRLATAPGQELAATSSPRQHHGPGHRPCGGVDTTPEDPRRADPRVRTDRMTVIDLVITLQVSEDDKDLEPYTRLLPENIWLIERTQPRTARPLRSALITRASALLRAGPPAHPATVLSPSRHQHRLERSLSPAPRQRAGQYRDTPSPVPRGSRRPGSRRLHAGHRLASQRTSARLIPR